MSDLTAPLTFTVPLTQAEHLIAEQFRRQQTDPQKAKQVYLNALAVYAVSFYLNCMGFETDLSASDSFDPVMQTFMDVADLEVKHIGKLECRPVLPDSQVCRIPLEVWSDRIGYVAVQLNESLREATLLGFVETVTTEELPIVQMQSLEIFKELLDEHFSKIEQPATTQSVTLDKTVVNYLLQWFDNIFERGWQKIEHFINPQELSFVRNTKVRRAKLIDLGIDLAGYPIILIVNLTRENEQTVGVHFQIYPTGEHTYLPPQLKLIILTESGDIFKEVTARSADKFIQYQFEAERGDKFSVKVALGDVSISEEFVI